jgi:translation initiation factor eIF-2B subunit alpha
MSLSARTQIAEVGHSFVQDGFTVLIHGNSRVVSAVLLKAAETTQFSVIVTEGQPGNIDLERVQPFLDAGIPTKFIMDSAVGVIMEEVDLCLVGAEGVAENGGIINEIGTYQMALVAQALHRPFYVAVESYKFSRMYPLSQKDAVAMTQTRRVTNRSNGADSSTSSLIVDLPAVDFTPANFITLMFTDLGVLTPTAVSDELIRLYAQ